jgi:hypothetical protein
MSAMPRCEISMCPPGRRSREARGLGRSTAMMMYVVQRGLYYTVWGGIGLVYSPGICMYVPIDEDRLELVEMLGILQTARSTRTCGLVPREMVGSLTHTPKPTHNT